MNKSYRITLLNDSGGPSNNIVGTAEVCGKDILISITEDWQTSLPEQSEEYNSLCKSILDGAQKHSMQGYVASGTLINAWRFSIEEIVV
jgi:hypothetical protein